jgi:hypothetical protein
MHVVISHLPRSRPFCWCICKWHVSNAILLLRCHVAVLVFIDDVNVLLGMATGLGRFFDRYEQPSRDNQVSGVRSMRVPRELHLEDETLHAPTNGHQWNRIEKAKPVNSPPRRLQLIHKFLLEPRRRRSNML